MKNNLLKILSIVMIAFGVWSCNDDDETPVISGLDVVSTAETRADLTFFVSAVNRANLTLPAGNFTVFAPSNEAFQNLVASNDDWQTLEDIPVPLLRSVLLYHVVENRMLSTELENTYLNTLSLGPNDQSLSLLVEVSDEVTLNGSAEPVQLDILATNGVVHIIDEVMMMPDLVGKALQNDNFSLLVEALTDSRLSTDFVSLLQTDGPFTVFAPTNEAFQDLLDSNDQWNAISDIPAATLEAVLAYHVVEDANVQSSQLQDEQRIETVNGDDLVVELDGGVQLETTSDQTVALILANVQTSNGVIHAVRNVLLTD